MRIQNVAIALALAGASLSPATAQQPGASSPQSNAEREAAGVKLLQAEKLLSAGQRGPESETCKLMDAYFLHIVKVAVAAGAKTRIADWRELTWEEQDAVAKGADPLIERNRRLRSTACSDNSR